MYLSLFSFKPCLSFKVYSTSSCAFIYIQVCSSLNCSFSLEFVQLQVMSFTFEFVQLRTTLLHFLLSQFSFKPHLYIFKFVRLPIEPLVFNLLNFESHLYMSEFVRIQVVSLHIKVCLSSSHAFSFEYVWFQVPLLHFLLSLSNFKSCFSFEFI